MDEKRELIFTEESNENEEPKWGPYNTLDYEFKAVYDPTSNHPYLFRGRIYDESDMIWVPLVYHHDNVGCNIDPGETRFHSQFTPSIVALVSDGKLSYSLPGEANYLHAKELAAKHKEPGFVVICSHGQFVIPCEVFYSPEYNNVDFVIRIFNGEFCQIENRMTWATLIAEIDDAHIDAGIRFARGKELDWRKAVEDCKKYNGTAEIQYVDFFGDDGYDDYDDYDDEV